MSNEVIALLRNIRDSACQYERCHEGYSSIEQMATLALKELGIVDGPPFPNPRCIDWWK
jgi:hypothetical protein